MPYDDASVAHDASSSTYRFDHILSLNEPGPSPWGTLLQSLGVPDVYAAFSGTTLASTSKLDAVDISIPQLNEGWASNLSYEEASMGDNTCLMPHSCHMPSVPEAFSSPTASQSAYDVVYAAKDPSTINPALLSIPRGEIVPLAPPATSFACSIPPASISLSIDIPFPSGHAIGTLYMTDHADVNAYDSKRAPATNSDARSSPSHEPSRAAGYHLSTANLPSRARKNKTGEATGRYECRSRNKNAEIPDELIVLALQDPSRGCPVDGCAYVPTAIGKPGSGQASNMLRHIESHREKQWVCCGLPLNVAIEKGLRQEGDPPNFFHGGQPMIGGCVHYLSRRDSLARHLKGKGRDCLTDISIVENHIRERRANLMELLRQCGK